jgi:hypothetical protein
MRTIDIDEARVAKLPSWAQELIGNLSTSRENAVNQLRQAQQDRQDAEDRLHAYMEGNLGPADSDTFLERDDAHYGEDAPALGLGNGAVVSFFAPNDIDGTGKPSIQARVRDDRLILRTDGSMLLSPTGSDEITVTLA